MRKNKMMRLASVLLVAVLMTTSVISGTFAKYVTSNNATDSARVAKWGVEITANGTTFADAYKNDEEIGANAVGTVNSVENISGDNKNLLAPGTAGELVECVLAGTPEVAVEVKYEATLELTGWLVTGDFDGDDTVEVDETDIEYFPVIFTVNGATYGTEDTTATNKSANMAALIIAVEEAIEDYTAEYGANTNLATEATVATPDVSWSWPIETSAVNNIKDTYLGDAADDGNASTISLRIDTTVTQLD